MRYGRHDHDHDHPMRRRRGGRMRRGDTKTALLAALAEAPAHGYELMQRIEDKSGGAWRPSPGSVYPTLQMLEDEGLVRVSERDGKRIFEITDEGRAEGDRRVEEAGGAPWDAVDGGSDRGSLRESMRLLGLAVRQSYTVGTKEQVDATAAIVTDARKRIYQLLGES